MFIYLEKHKGNKYNNNNNNNSRYKQEQSHPEQFKSNHVSLESSNYYAQKDAGNIRSLSSQLKGAVQLLLSDNQPSYNQELYTVRVGAQVRQNKNIVS